MKSAYTIVDNVLYNKSKLCKAIAKEANDIAAQLRDETWAKEEANITRQAYAVTCFVLHHAFGFGAERLKRLTKELGDFSDMMNTGFAGKTADAMDCVEWIKEYAGIDLYEEWERNRGEKGCVQK
jgi:hypothetical protein